MDGVVMAEGREFGRDISGAQWEAVGQSAPVEEMLIACPAGKALARRLGLASRPIEKQPSAISQHELGLPGQRLDILADLQTDADRGAVEEEIGRAHV